MDSPLVSVIILYCNRRGTIQETIDSAVTQDYSHREIIVVDNHSQDDLSRVIECRGYAVSLIELPQNLGACAGRNAGIRAARGDILVFLDDDVSFRSTSELRKTVEAFNQHPQIHVLAFQVCDPETGELRLREWCHPRHWKEFGESEFETHYFGEGACAFRREVFEVAGLYYEAMFIAGEGHDLAVRLLDHGFRILYCSRVRVGHRAAMEGRSSDRQYYYLTRNFIWMAYKDYHFLDGLRFGLPNLLMMSYFTLRSGFYGPFLRGVWHGFTGLSQVRPDRKPIRKATVKYWAALEKWRPGLVSRFARHRTEPQL
jgi:GT2 family glycosyltransferase